MGPSRARGLPILTSATPGDLVERFLDLAIAGDTKAAVRLAIDALDDDVPERDIIVGLLAAAQRESGNRWHRNEWSVADEHLVSGVVQSVLDVLEAFGTGVDASTEHGFVAVACAEGDWHAVPAHMFANMLRAEGFAVAFLGSSTPAEHVADFLANRHPDALAISCNIPLYFNGVTRLATVAHDNGVPVLAGSRALGDRPDRALRLGADAWAPDVPTAAAVLDGWHEHGPPLLAAPVSVDVVALDLDSRAQDLAATAFESLTERFPAMAQYDQRQLARTREDLAFIVRFVAAAQLVDDPTVLTDFLDWLRDLLVARHVPAAALTAGLEVLAPELQQFSPATAALAAEGLTFVHRNAP
jgi:methanogenic corrinoid protein MtbC1